MKLLMCHNFFHERGGAERYLFDTTERLRARGHDVVHFSTRHPGDRPSPESSYFVKARDLGGHVPLRELPAAAAGLVWNLEASRSIDRLIRDRRPDAAFLHNIYQFLSPSILPVLKRHGLPVVMHVADYKLVCPAYQLHDGNSICEACRGGRFHNAVRRRCVKGSLVKSLGAAVESTVHRLSGVYARHVDAFLCPSRFVRDRLVALGFPADRLHYFPQALSIEGLEPSDEPDDGSLLYVGRLVRTKGVDTLLRAVSLVPGARLRVVGDREEKEALEARASELGVLDRVEFLGHRSGPALFDLFRRSRCLVVPSEWYEVFGLVIYEAMALGRAVVGARIGGIPELVEHERTGLLFTPGDVDELAGRLRTLLDDADRARALGRAGRRRIETELHPDRSLDRILDIYRQLSGARAGDVRAAGAYAG